MTKPEIQRHRGLVGYREHGLTPPPRAFLPWYLAYNRDRDPGDEDEDGRCLSGREAASKGER